VTASSFADPDFVARYRNGPARFVPGHEAMLRMSAQLLAEGAPETARILVVGAGGGIELGHFAAYRRDWRFVGVDPAAAMLALAREALGTAAERCELIEGTVDDAPQGPFDGASCLLTLHLIPDDGAKLSTLIAIRSRLRAGAAFVIVDNCIDLSAPRSAIHLDRYLRYGAESGAPAEDIDRLREQITSVGQMVSREREIALLTEAGFTSITLFYAGLSWTGCVARA
jgi:tRNA (cmo5U34)-methyltransferase